MEFYNEHNERFDNSKLEIHEQRQANTYITPDCVVLELGARYGTVSCIINKKLSNPMNQVSVEPDERVHKALEENMIRNNCNFHIVKGFISRTPMKLSTYDGFLGGYATYSTKVENSTIPSYTIEEIEAKYNLKFNTLVADCEGFLEQFFDENPHLYDQINLMLIEKDRDDTCNYSKILDNLKSHGFVCLESPGWQEVWKKQ